MRTPLLLEVPQDSPTRKQRLDQIKKLFEIETHNCGPDPDKEWDQWMAAHIPSARAMGKAYGVLPTDGLFECGCKVGRLMDESGIADYGKTEREAIQKVCENLGLPLTL